MTALPRLGRFFSDRLNAVLVKEVRQALRGNYFRWTFWATLSGATLIAFMQLIWERGPAVVGGQEFFQIEFACLAFAAHAFVPFSAFMAMGGEWEENTYDLLCLSDLKPRQVVLGKVLAAGVQAALYYCAFGPFLVFSFLLKGIDPLVVLLLLGGSMLLSLCLSAAAVAISTLSTKRQVRMLLQATLAFVLLGATTASIQAGFWLSMMPHLVREPEFVAVAGIVAITLLWLTTFSFAAAVSRLAHSEENASTPGRVLTLVAVPWAIAGFLMVVPTMGGHHGEIAFLWFCFASCALFANAVLFSSERERLGRRVRSSVPRQCLRAFLLAPLLPGGGRGLLFFLVSEALLIVGLGAARLASGETLRAVLDDDHSEAMGLLVAYGFTYLAFAPVLVKSPERVGVRRMVTLALIGAGAFLPSAVGFFVGSSLLRRGEHAGNPVWGVERAFRSGPQLMSLLPLFVVCTVALILSLRRMSNGIGEVLDASRANAKRGREVASAVSEGRAA